MCHWSLNMQLCHARGHRCNLLKYWPFVVSVSRVFKPFAFFSDSETVILFPFLNFIIGIIIEMDILCGNFAFKCSYF